ncbi:hypothetical protein AQS8620_02602 [Aquimixticola soesokkakensis]|uniref:Excalibur calcium-binding domain-containing protein n=1 Tax=Aquimixticola soesokkakensis TaxID=1519096 RepID=A0A1Y5TCJ3_9RHOB|nr:hypothetical protein [Aquimixticola soesokkakensis]SLN58829.1 hypothetical protein AQS8620_02602 [Aquimixticola soesokkakensis]
MRILFSVLPVAALMACSPSVPDSGAGVGFSDYASYQQQREEQLIAQGEGTGSASPSYRAPISNETITGGAVSTQSLESSIPADPTGQFPAERSQDVASAVTNSVGISEEQDFSAVASERSIEEDAARVAANKQAYQVIEPTALPPRPSGSTASLVEFAISTTNRVGEPLYSRLIIGAEARAARNCAKYPSPDKAQEAFLEKGGPARDSSGLDPDGDGFACAWDPTPFRLAARG